MKKIEFIIEKRFLDDLLELLDDNQVEGYSVIDIYRGKGQTHGKTKDLGFIPVTKYFLVISLCNETIFKKIESKILDYVKESQGYIYFYDVKTPCL